MRKRKYEELELDDGTVVRYRRHDNGGGMVAMRAQADPSARIEETAWVDPDATVCADARLGPGCWVEPGARVEKGAYLATAVHVGADAVVGPYARIGSRTRLGAGAHVLARVTVGTDLEIPAGARVTSAGVEQEARAA